MIFSLHVLPFVLVRLACTYDFELGYSESESFWVYNVSNVNFTSSSRLHFTGHNQFALHGWPLMSRVDLEIGDMTVFPVTPLMYSPDYNGSSKTTARRLTALCPLHPKYCTPYPPQPTKIGVLCC